MSYVSNTLLKDEKVVLSAKISMLSLISAILCFIVLLLVGGFMISFTIAAQFYTGIAEFVIGVVLVLIGFVNILSKLLKIKTTELAVTNKKIIGKVGVIKVSMMESPLNKINDIAVQQGLFGRILNYGKVSVSTSSGKYNFEYVSDPAAFRRTAMEQIEEFDNERVKKQAEQLKATMENSEN